LVNKKAVTYRHIFDELKQLVLDRVIVFSPITIMSDFESGVIPVVKSEVSDICYEEDFSMVFQLYIFLMPLIKALRMFFSFLPSCLSSNPTFRNAIRLFNK
jgi:hypothetical protein